MLCKSASERKSCAKNTGGECCLSESAVWQAGDGKVQHSLLPKFSQAVKEMRLESASLPQWPTFSLQCGHYHFSIRQAFDRGYKESRCQSFLDPSYLAGGRLTFAKVPLSHFPHCPLGLEDTFISDVHKNPQKCAESGKDMCPYWGGGPS